MSLEVGFEVCKCSSPSQSHSPFLLPADRDVALSAPSPAPFCLRANVFPAMAVIDSASENVSLSFSRVAVVMVPFHSSGNPNKFLYSWVYVTLKSTLLGVFFLDSTSRLEKENDVMDFKHFTYVLFHATLTEHVACPHPRTWLCRPIYIIPRVSESLIQIFLVASDFRFGSLLEFENIRLLWAVYANGQGLSENEGTDRT